MLIVQKYGGTSVADHAQLAQVARRIVRARARGDDLVTVVSAMGHETDRLLALAYQVTAQPDDREVDMLLSAGERVTSALLAMTLQEQGCPARSFTGRQAGILTDEMHARAGITRVEAGPLREVLRDGIVPVVAGFQGSTPQGEETTLGRGGSDTTAVALAAALGADRCEIFTDVDGVYTTDPSIVPEARKLDRISYEEMLEMASLGAKVLQARAVEYAAQERVPIWVKSNLTDGPGTLVTEEDAEMGKRVVAGVTYDRDQVKITVLAVPDRPGIAARLFGPVGERRISVDIIVQNVSQDGLTDISFTVGRGDAREALAITRRAAKEIGARDVILRDEIAKVSVVGLGMRAHSGVAAGIFAALAQQGINIIMISTSEIKVSCIIEAKDTDLAVKVLHEAYGLGLGG